ncbi:hypothetical protein PYCC9005_001431 [Savitreella phatthalungensis]
MGLLGRRRGNSDVGRGMTTARHSMTHERGTWTGEDDGRTSSDDEDDWDPFYFSTRRGSLGLDPSAFESAPALLTHHDNGPSHRLRKSADALRGFGKKMMQIRRRESRDETSSSSTTTGRSRSNTVDSLRSLRSKPSLPQLSKLDDPASEKEEGSELFPDVDVDVLPPVPPTIGDRSSSSMDSTSASRRLPTLPEVVAEFRHPSLEDIMRQMQEEDAAFEATEHQMVTSGWSSDAEIAQLRKRRLEQHNLWQRRLDDALDAIKATVEL